MTHPTEESGITERERAQRIVMLANGGRDGGTIRGLRGAEVVTQPISLRRLADYGVPQTLDLPFDTKTLRALVQELAQIEVD